MALRSTSHWVGLSRGAAFRICWHVAVDPWVKVTLLVTEKQRPAQYSQTGADVEEGTGA